MQKTGLILILAFFIVLLTLASVSAVEVHDVVGKSMEPIIHHGDRVMVTNNLKDIRLGDILVFWYDDYDHFIVHRLNFIDYHPMTAAHYGMWGVNNDPRRIEWINKAQVVGKVIRVFK